MIFTNTRLSLFTAAAMAAIFLSGHVASGVTFSSGTGLGISIPDNGYDGSFASTSMASSSITVSGLLGTITDVNVTIAMQHDIAGDVTIKLVSPNSTVVTLLNLPGNSPSVPDNGSGVGGVFADFAVQFPITYDDQAPSDLAHDAENMGVIPSVSSTQDIGDPSLNSPDTYFPDADGALPDGKLDSYNGEAPIDANGSWTLYIGDSAAGGLGSLDHWSLDIQTNAVAAVPEVNTAALAGLALLAAGMGVISRRRVLPAPIQNRKSKIENDRKP